MIPMLALLVGYAQTPEAIMKRFETVMANVRTLSVEVKVAFSSNFSGQTAQGKLYLGQKPRVRFSMQWPNTKYTFISSPRGAIEIDDAAKIYKVFRPVTVWAPPPSELAGAPSGYFPTPLIVRSVKSLAPPGSKYRIVPGGGGYSTIETRFTNERGGTSLVRLTFDGAGRLTKLREGSVDGASQVYSEITLSNYQFNPTLPESLFVATPPVGFVPDELPDERIEIQTGMKFPLTGWNVLRKAPGTNGLQPAKGRFALIVTGPSSDPVTARTIKFLEANDARLQKMKITTWWALPKGGHASAKTGILQEQSNVMQKLELPSSPFWFLIDDRGVIIRMWNGFDPSNTRQYWKDIDAALKEAAG
jgi:hypothetical protein